jgi:ferredoxin
MGEVEIKFERENLSGVVAVGTYLNDAGKRLGIRFQGECVPQEDIHFCRFVVSEGNELLSELTRLEREHFAGSGRTEGERLACQTKLERAGEIVIMTEEKKTADAEEATADDKSEKYRKEFVGMPLEKKIASLVELEAIALGETFSFIVNSPFKVFDKVMDVMAEFGLKRRRSPVMPHARRNTAKHLARRGQRSTRNQSPRQDRNPTNRRRNNRKERGASLEHRSCCER